MALTPREKGERRYESLDPKRQAFFMSVAKELSEGEVLLSNDLQRQALAANLHWRKEDALRATNPLWSQNVLLFLNVVVDKLQLDSVPRRTTLFDRQIPAEELRIEDALKRNGWERLPWLIEERAETWREQAEARHQLFILESEREWQTR